MGDHVAKTCAATPHHVSRKCPVRTGASAGNRGHLALYVLSVAAPSKPGLAGIAVLHEETACGRKPLAYQLGVVIHRAAVTLKPGHPLIVRRREQYERMATVLVGADAAEPAVGRHIRKTSVAAVKTRTVLRHLLVCPMDVTQRQQTDLVRDAVCEQRV